MPRVFCLDRHVLSRTLTATKASANVDWSILRRMENAVRLTPWHLPCLEQDTKSGEFVDMIVVLGFFFSTKNRAGPTLLDRGILFGSEQRLYRQHLQLQSWILCHQWSVR